MVHGPYGLGPKSTGCLQGGKCNKHFPKKFYEQTIIREDGFPSYKRRDIGLSIKKKGIVLENRYVTPFNRNLLAKFNAYINVKACNHFRSIKYLFKYINKGPDRATTIFEETNDSPTKNQRQTHIALDEIKKVFGL